MMKNNIDVIKYYVYLHIKLTDGAPFYIGKGCSYRYNSKRDRNKWWHNTVNKYGFDVIILESNLTNEEALKQEMYWIDRIGRRDLGNGPLVNLTNGGEGETGRIPHNKGITGVIKFSDEINKKKGKPQSQEHKDKISLLMKGNNYAKVNKGKKKSDRTKYKMSEFLKSDKNPRCKKIIANGVEYFSIQNCMTELKMTKFFILKKCNDINESNWYII